ncbi:hypothetical protein ROA7450_00218 [Roseovarius albus]|uniref:Uncharacterized protein n=1 Tax=Roseovarius albus TaxID=1247867 RepID=A0A1X6Y8C0_9RHOB|nr:hypothetical protein [Roseovarius albus]SLN13758.1 hypothetical protein ROA7450_00218 [Roseovarius albus]
MSKLIHSQPICILALQLWLCAVSTFASAGNEMAAGTTQTAGLMWNRTGLPAVFPLQVKTPAGQDYFLTLIDAESGEDAMAAYIAGGAFFKVLVPPGEFRLKFAAGVDWQGEEFLFGSGANTHVFELNETFTFEIQNLTVKAGHLVNIMEIEPGQAVQSSAKAQLICQTLRRTYPSRGLPYGKDRFVPQTGNRHGIISGNGLHRYLGERRNEKNTYPTPHEHYFFEPEFSVTSRYCG